MARRGSTPAILPFWGRPGRRRPELRGHFRRTELQAQEIAGAQPKSVFQIGGAGAVGTASLRGMPHLTELTRAGFSVWPFHEPRYPLVLEIYPRLLTGPVVKSDPAARAAYIEATFPEIGDGARDSIAGSEDALDTAISAVVMARNLDRIEALEKPGDAVLQREGLIWHPEEDTPSGVSAETSCPFCEVQVGEVADGSRHAFAIPDGYPVTEGHTLVIPRRHVESLFDLEPDARQDLWALVARTRERLQAQGGIDSFTIGVNDGEAAGQTLPHAHVHVIPRRSGDVGDPRGGIRWVVPERAAYWED